MTIQSATPDGSGIWPADDGPWGDGSPDQVGPDWDAIEADAGLVARGEHTGGDLAGMVGMPRKGGEVGKAGGIAMQGASGRGGLVDHGSKGVK